MPSSQSTGPGNRLACPNCLSPEWLGENIIGWRECGEIRMVAGSIKTERKGSAEDCERISFFCSNRTCNVDEAIVADRLVQLDADGNPVVEQPAEQGRLA